MKNIYLIFGFIFMIIGATGIILPILPTTPFLLLASYCFTRGSTKFEVWFKGTNLYKNYLEEFEENRSMLLKVKIRIVSLATIMLLLAMLMTDVLAVRFLLVGVIGFLFYYFTFRIETLKE